MAAGGFRAEDHRPDERVVAPRGVPPETPEPAAFGSQLRLLRVRAGLTQDALAARAGVSVATIAALEEGRRRRPYPHTVAALCEALGLAPADHAGLLEAAQAVMLSRSVATPPRKSTLDASSSGNRRPPGPAAVRHNLPAPWTSFVGRVEERAEVRRLLATKRLVTLTGPGGCGKTRLGLQVASEVLQEHADGVWLVELGELSDGELLPRKLATTLGIREVAGPAPVDVLVETLRTWHALLVLDNCEHVLAASAVLVNALLRGCPSLHILTTSRESLGLSGEVTWPVRSLSLPFLQRLGTGAVAVTACQRSEAVQLFLDRALAAQPSFKLTEHNASVIAQICVRLDGIPLALELAAPRLKAMTPELLAERLDDRFRLLGSENRAVAARQRTLLATIDWSYEMLSEPERRLFQGLSTFAGGFTLQAAERVCGGEEVPRRRSLLDVLVRLVDRSMVVVEEQPGGRLRYRLLETLRQYAAERLAETDECEALHRRHFNCYLAMAEQAEPELLSPGAVNQLDALEIEHSNLRAALEWICTGGEVEQGLRLAGALAGFWWVRGYAREGSAWLDQLLMLADGKPVPATVRAKALHGAAVLSNAIGSYARVTARHEESAALFMASGDVLGAARAVNSLGGAAYDEGDLHSARALWEQSLMLAREANNAGEIARSLGHVGLADYHLGDLARAEATLNEALGIARQACRKDVEAIHLGDLANVARRHGDLTRAAALQRTTLQMEVALGDQRQIAICLEHLTGILAAQGYGKRAARLLGAAQVVRDLIGSPIPVPESADLEDAIAQARATLTEPEWTAAIVAGRSLPVELAIAEALDVRQAAGLPAPQVAQVPT